MENNFKNEVLAVFKPQTTDINAIAESCKGLKINGIEDEEGYKQVFDALQILKKARVNLTKFAKSLRDEYTAKNREIKNIEEDYLAIIAPIEDELKAERERIDEEKRRQERLILLPSRRILFDEINMIISDDEILSMDEKQFAIFYDKSKIVYLEAKESQRREEEAKKEREAQIEKEKAEAVANAIKLAQEQAEKDKIEAEKKAKEAILQAEKDKQDAIDKIKREQEAIDKKRIDDEKARIAEENRIKLEKIEDQAKAEKNKKYQEWLVTVKYSPIDGDKIERVGDTFIAYKKVGEIIIK